MHSAETFRQLPARLRIRSALFAMDMNLCSRVPSTSSTSPPNPVPSTHCAAVSLLLEYSIIPVLQQLHVLVPRPKHSAPRFCRAALSWHSVCSWNMASLMRSFADNTQYQFAPCPCHCRAIFQVTVLLYLSYLWSASNILIYFLTYCLWPLIRDKRRRTGTLSLIYKWVLQQLEQCLAHNNTA